MLDGRRRTLGAAALRLVRRLGFLGCASAVAIALPGCLFGNDEVDSREDALRSARGRWQAAEIADYSVRLAVGCFCYCPRSFVVLVEDDALAGVAEVEPSEGVPPEDLEELARTCARTVDQMFDIIATHVEDADGFDVEYDGTLGYPTVVAIDPDERTADEEIYFTLSNLDVADAAR